MMSEPSSNISQQPSAFFDPESSSWKTSQASFPFPGDQVEDSMSLDRLPPWGTTADGVLFEQGMPALLTGVRDGSASLSTPTAWMGRRPAHAKGDAERWYDPERSNELSDQMAALLPTPRAQLADARNTRPWVRPLDQPQNLENAIGRVLLPTPVVNDMGAGKTVEQWDSWTAEMKAKHGNSNGHGPSLSVEAARLLPTPTAGDCKVFGPNIDWEKRKNHSDSPATTLMDMRLSGQTDWGKYGATINRWEDTIGRKPPPPTDERGLLPKFVEWMMGLPEGWVCDLGLPRTAELKALGNGVVPQQAALALQLLDPA